MSAFIVSDQTINNLANTFNFIAEYDQSCGRTPYEVRRLIQDLKIQNGGSYPTGVIFIDENQANESAKKIAQALYDLNVRAVNYRYNKNDDTEFTAFKNKMPINNKFQLLKSLHCLIYQCSEGNIPNDPLYKRLETISSCIAIDIVKNLPEYDAAAWD